MVSNAKIKSARIKAEQRIYQLLDDLEQKKDGYNATKMKNFFSKLSDEKFIEFMKSMATDDNINIYYELDSFSDKDKDINLKHISKVAKKYDVQLRQYVAFPHKNPDDPEHLFITKSEVPKLYVSVRRLVQLLHKKNFASANVDVVNSLTGQVTGDSKAAALTDTQTASLAAVDMKETLKEFLGFRADDMEDKMKAIDSIEKYGEVKLSDLQNNPYNRQSVQTMITFLRGSGLNVSIKKQKK